MAGDTIIVPAAPNALGKPKPPQFFIGLDLGKSMDYTAAAIIEVSGKAPEDTYHCRHLHRYRLGT